MNPSGQRRPIRHCEEPLRRSNPGATTYAAPATQTVVSRPLDCFASLAMTDRELARLFLRVALRSPFARSSDQTSCQRASRSLDPNRAGKIARKQVEPHAHFRQRRQIANFAVGGIDGVEIVIFVAVLVLEKQHEP